MALVTSIANDGDSLTLNQAVSGVDYIYVVVPMRKGPARGARGVFSYYEFLGS